MDFSIVTASFRQLELLKSCIASVADQEGVTLEHVIQDGGTPGFPKFAQEMAQRWPERPGYLRPMLSEPDSGMYDGINRALKRSRGRICGYLNSDEQYLPGALAAVLKKFREEPKLGAVLGDVVVIRPDGNPLCFRKMVIPQLAHTWTCHFSALTAGIFFSSRTFGAGPSVRYELPDCGRCRMVCPPFGDGHPSRAVGPDHLDLFRERAKSWFG